MAEGRLAQYLVTAAGELNYFRQYFLPIRYTIHPRVNSRRTAAPSGLKTLNCGPQLIEPFFFWA